MRSFIASLGIVAIIPVFLLFGQTPESSRSATFPDPVNTEADLSTTAMAPEEAARGFRVPDGFRVNVYAAEPDVQNPIAMAWDARGRLWVAENYTYADRSKKFDLSLRDRVLIFEDADGDGRFDKRTVFTDDVQMLTGIEIGNGGVWLMTPPQLIFVPDHNGDDHPDGAPIVMLDGFTPSRDNYHTFANGLKWGPDGWLYGRCGASSPGRLGVPGAPNEQRVPLFGGVWRFRPEGHVAGTVEVLCHGTTNPWGMDWNEYGEAFFINTVNGHLWHVIPGAHFRRPHSEDPNPYVFNTIDTHADHYHWDTGKTWMDSRKVTGEHDRLGGGHAHCGATIYLGDNWPDSYRGRLFTLNLHGRRVNVERLEQSGCGYVAMHEPDTLHAADPWFRGIDLSYGPDGAVYILDWSDTGECHEHTGVHRKSGRIYRVAYGDRKSASDPSLNGARLADMSKLDENGLVSLHRHKNEWFVRQARRVLAGRLRDPTTQDAVAARAHAVGQLLEMFEQDSDLVIKLRVLHSAFALQGTDQPFLLKLLHHANEHVRAWAIRLLVDNWPLDTIMGQVHPAAINPKGADREPELISATILDELVQLAQKDDSKLVRLVLASALQRIPIKERLRLAHPLSSRSEDADDHNLPLMVWYGLLPLTIAMPGENLPTVEQVDQLAAFANSCQLPETRQMISRRLGELIDERPTAVNRLLAGAELPMPLLNDFVKGLAKGLTGHHKAKAPYGWDTLVQRIQKSDDAELQALARDLSVLFGDGRALEEVERIALNAKGELAERRAALKTLIDNRAPNRRKICEQLLNVRYLNTTAVGGLTEFDDPSIGSKLATHYGTFFIGDRPAVIDALVSRPSFAEPLLDQIASGKIPRADLTVVHARQIRSFNTEKLTRRLSEVWGDLRDSPADKQNLIAQLKTQLSQATISQADKGQGRAVFNKICGNCHRLYGHGSQIGPDLTGSGRHNLDYLLLNMVDPSAAVGAEYRMSVIALKDGRVLNGIVASRTDRVLTLQTPKDRITIERSDIEEEHASTQSLMPDGQLQQMTAEQIRDLVAYLMHPTQVPVVGVMSNDEK